MADNQFLDINNPPRAPYTHQAFPTLVYRADGHVRTVANEDELKAAKKDGFSKNPHSGWDYTKIRSGRAVKASEPEPDGGGNYLQRNLTVEEPKDEETDVA